MSGTTRLGLTRLYLRNVGPDVARFDPLDLDLCADGQLADRVLWSLTNTGGKTTLIKLLSSVIVPHARDQVGHSNIGSYVRAEDVSHIVLEWAHGEQRFVTAAVYEWPDHRRPVNAAVSELRREWYTFRVGTFGVDDLPFDTIDARGVRRRRSLADYRTRMHELFRAHPQARFVWARQQGEWAAALDSSTPIDAELFRYQMRMNDQETGAGTLVQRFSTVDAAVSTIIEIANDEAVFDDLTATLTVYAEQAGRRGQWETERDFCEELGAALAELAARHDEHVTADAAAVTARMTGDELAGALDARLADAAETLAGCRDELTGLSVERDELAARRNLLDAQRRQVDLETARLDAAAAAVEHAAAAAACAEIRGLLDAWEAVPLLQRLDDAAARHETARRAFEQAEGRLSPLREATREAGAALAAKFRQLASDADTALAAAGETIADADARSAALRQQTATLQAMLHDVVTTETRLEATIDAAAAATAALTGRGIVEPDETIDVALRRVHGELERVAATVDTLEREVDDHAASLQRLAVQRRHTVEARAAAARRLDAATGARRDFERERRLFDTETLTALAGHGGDGTVEGPRDAAQLADAAARQAETAETAASRAEQQLGEVNAEIASLTEDDLLGGNADVESVHVTLRDAGIGSTTALRWLAENVVDAEQRVRFIRGRPDLANAVVVLDRSRLGDARDTLAAVPYRGRIAVLVCGTGPLAGHGDDGTLDGAEDGAEDGPGGDGFVLEPRRAVFDPQWAQRTLAELAGQRRHLDDSVTATRQQAAQLRRAGAELAGFAQRWQGHDRGTLDADLAAAEAAHDLLHAELAALDDAHDRTTTAKDTAAVQLQHVSVERARLDATLADLHAAAEKAAAARDAAAELVSARARRDEMTARQARIDEEQEIQRRRRDRAAADAADARAEGQRHRERQAAVGYEPAAGTPSGGLAALSAEFETLTSRLRHEESGSGHAATLGDTEAAHAQARIAVEQLPGPVREQAATLSGTLPAANTAILQQTIEQARDAFRAAVTREQQTAGDAQRAQRTVQDRTPAGGVHAELPEGCDAGDDRSLRDAGRELDTLAGDCGRRHDDVTARIAALTNLLRDLESDTVRFESVRRLWRGGSLDGMSSFPGSHVEARARMDEALQHAEDALRALSATVEARRDAFDVVRGCANDERWAALASPLRERCRNNRVDELCVHASGWVEQLAVRVRSLREDLEQIDVHRELLVGNLETVCDTQRRLLRDVTNRSKLPQGLGALSGQPAFRIDFEPRPENEVHGRLTRCIDEWAQWITAEPGRRVRSEQRLRWVTQALRETVKDRPNAGTFAVKVLKPRIDGSLEYCTPDRVSQEYSGGQELTLAILIYCTLAAVRAAHRSGGERPAGSLVLDNPVGASSNPKLLRIQQALAARSGIQLVCATGLNDPAVLTAFEGPTGKVLRLRNDRDQRRGLRHLRVDDSVAELVASRLAGGHDADDPSGWLDAVGYSTTVDPPDDLPGGPAGELPGMPA